MGDLVLVVDCRAIEIPLKKKKKVIILCILKLFTFYIKIKIKLNEFKETIKNNLLILNKVFIFPKIFKG